MSANHRKGSLRLVELLLIAMVVAPFFGVTASARSPTGCDAQGFGTVSKTCSGTGWCDSGDYAVVSASVDDNGEIHGTAACNGTAGPQGQAFATCGGYGSCNSNSYPGTVVGGGGSLQCDVEGNGGWWTHARVDCSSNPSGTTTANGALLRLEDRFTNMLGIHGPIYVAAVCAPTGNCVCAEDCNPVYCGVCSVLCVLPVCENAHVSIDITNSGGIITATAVRCDRSECAPSPVKLQQFTNGLSTSFKISA